jgi:hypothetical protein
MVLFSSKSEGLNRKEKAAAPALGFFYSIDRRFLTGPTWIARGGPIQRGESRRT